MAYRSSRDESAGLLFVLIFLGVCFAAWITHVIVCISAHLWFFLLAGAICFPIAIVHGIGIWFGAWG